MEIKAISEALKCLQQRQCRRAVIVTDSMSTLQKVQKEVLFSDLLSKQTSANSFALTRDFHLKKRLYRTAQNFYKLPPFKLKYLTFVARLQLQGPKEI